MRLDWFTALQANLSRLLKDTGLQKRRHSCQHLEMKRKIEMIFRNGCGQGQKSSKKISDNSLDIPQGMWYVKTTRGIRQ